MRRQNIHIAGLQAGHADVAAAAGAGAERAGDGAKRRHNLEAAACVQPIDVSGQAAPNTTTNFDCSAMAVRSAASSFLGMSSYRLARAHQ